TGHDDRYMHIGLEQFRVQPFGQQFHRRLAGAVHALAGEREEATHAGHVGDVALGPGQQDRKEGLHHVDGPHEVDVEHSLDVGVGQLGHWDEGLDDPSVVDDAVDRSVGPLDLRYKVLHSIAVGDVDD